MGILTNLLKSGDEQAVGRIFGNGADRFKVAAFLGTHAKKIDDIADAMKAEGRSFNALTGDEARILKAAYADLGTVMKDPVVQYRAFLRSFPAEILKGNGEENLVKALSSARDVAHETAGAPTKAQAAAAGIERRSKSMGMTPDEYQKLASYETVTAARRGGADVQEWQEVRAAEKAARKAEIDRNVANQITRDAKNAASAPGAKTADSLASADLKPSVVEGVTVADYKKFAAVTEPEDAVRTFNAAGEMDQWLKVRNHIVGDKFKTVVRDSVNELEQTLNTAGTLDAGQFFGTLRQILRDPAVNRLSARAEGEALTKPQQILNKLKNTDDPLSEKELSTLETFFRGPEFTAKEAPGATPTNLSHALPGMGTARVIGLKALDTASNFLSEAAKEGSKGKPKWSTMQRFVNGEDPSTVNRYIHDHPWRTGALATAATAVGATGIPALTTFAAPEDAGRFASASFELWYAGGWGDRGAFENRHETVLYMYNGMMANSGDNKNFAGMTKTLTGIELKNASAPSSEELFKVANVLVDNPMGKSGVLSTRAVEAYTLALASKSGMDINKLGDSKEGDLISQIQAHTRGKYITAEANRLLNADTAEDKKWREQKLTEFLGTAPPRNSSELNAAIFKKIVQNATRFSKDSGIAAPDSGNGLDQAIFVKYTSIKLGVSEEDLSADKAAETYASIQAGANTATEQDLDIGAKNSMMNYGKSPAAEQQLVTAPTKVVYSVNATIDKLASIDSFGMQGRGEEIKAKIQASTDPKTGCTMKDKLAENLATLGLSPTSQTLVTQAVQRGMTEECTLANGPR